jgi:hypothetical protein
VQRFARGECKKSATSRKARWHMGFGLSRARVRSASTWISRARRLLAALRTPAALVTASEEFSTARAMKRRAGANLVKTARIGPRDSLPDSPSASECSAQFFLRRRFKAAARARAAKQTPTIARSAWLAAYDASRFRVTT